MLKIVKNGRNTCAWPAKSAITVNMKFRNDNKRVENRVKQSNIKRITYGFDY